MLITLTRHLAILAEERSRYDALLEHYHALKMAGAHGPAVPSSPIGLEKRKADRVSEVIADIAGSNAALRRQLGAYARTARAEGTDDDDIVKKLMHWDADEDGTL